MAQKQAAGKVTVIAFGLKNNKEINRVCPRDVQKTKTNADEAQGRHHPPDKNWGFQITIR